MRLLFLVFLFSISSLASARLPDLIPYRKGDLWGYADSTKKVVIKPEYEHVEFFEHGRAIVMKGNKWGVIDVSGKKVLSLLYKRISYVGISGYWSATLLGNKVGLVDSTGKFSITPMYLEIFWSGGNYVSAQTDSGFTVFHKSGTKLFDTGTQLWDIPPQYDEQTASFTLTSHKKWGVVDLNGKQKIPFLYDRVHYCESGYFICTTESKMDFYTGRFKKVKKKRAMKKAKSCFVTGKSVVVPSYMWQHPYDGGVPLPVYKAWGWRTIVLEGYDTTSNVWVSIPKYDSTGTFNYGLATFVKDGKMGMVNDSFNEVLPPKYEVLLAYRDGIIMVMRRPRVDFHKDADLRLFMGYVDVHGTEYWED